MTWLELIKLKLNEEKAKGIVELRTGVTRVLVGREYIVKLDRISGRNKRKHDLRLVVEGGLGTSNGRQNRQ